MTDSSACIPLKKTWIFFLGASLMLFQVLAWGEQRELIIAYEDKEQPPYYLGNSAQVPEDYPGLAVELVQRLEEEIPQLSITLVRAPWARCLSGLASNQYDGIFNASYQPERLAIGWYPTEDASHQGALDTDKRLTRIAYSLYRRSDSSLRWDGLRWTGSPQALQSIGAPAGYSIVQDLRQQGIEVQEVPASRNALLMVQLGRLEGAVLQEVTGDALLDELQVHFGHLVKDYPPVEEKDYFLMLSHRLLAEEPELGQAIWEALARIRDRDTETLRQKYRIHQESSATLQP